MFEHSYTTVVDHVSKIHAIDYLIANWFFIYMMLIYFLKCPHLGIWMSGVIAWVMDRCMNFLSLSQYKMQRIDVDNVKIT